MPQPARKARKARKPAKTAATGAAKIASGAKAPAGSPSERPATSDAGALSPYDPARATCTPCHGTGRLTSGLGGEPHEVPCRWCDGAGRFVPGRDAQAVAEAGTEAAPPAPPAPAPL